jgi:acyl carrier protein
MRRSNESRQSLSLEDALAWIADVLATDPSQVLPETERVQLKGWDSLGQLVLMSALDQDYGIKLTQEELGSMASIQDILDVLDRHGRLSAS